MFSTLLLLLLLAAVALIGAESQAPLRAQWARIGDRTDLVLIPVRVHLVRECGTPAQSTNYIAGFLCDDSAQRVALACVDTHRRYICDNAMWKVAPRP